MAQAPRARTGKTVRGRVRRGPVPAKPRETDGNAPANGLPGGEDGLLAQKQQIRLPRRLESGEVRPVQVNLRLRQIRADTGDGEAALPRIKTQAGEIVLLLQRLRRLR